MYRNISRQIENRKRNSTVQEARRKSIWELQTHIFIIFCVKSIWKKSLWSIIRLRYDKWAVIQKSVCFLKTPFDWVSCFRTNGQNSSGNRPEDDFILCLFRFVKGIWHPQSCYVIEKTPISWLAGHHFILVQKLPFWPYTVLCFGKETYRNRCATRFNIGSFIICYIY